MRGAAIFALLFLASAPCAVAGVEGKYRNFLARQVRYYWGSAQEVSVFAAQIRQESGWNPMAESRHAAGLAQFTPETAEWISSVSRELREMPLSVSDSRFDWRWSIRAMVVYDAFLHRRLSRVLSARGEDGRVWPLTLRAYNGGPGWIYRELRECGADGGECCLRFRGKSACEENIEYPVAILERWKPLYEGWDRR